MKNVLLVGESWVSAATHYKGFDQFGSVTFHLGAEPLVKALGGSDFALTYMPAHEAAEAWRWARAQARQILHGMVDATLPALMATATADGPVEQVESAVRQQLVVAIDGALSELANISLDDGEAESAPAEGSAELQR